MPEQAILDLPLVEFEQFGGRPQAVLDFATQFYSLSGLPPHRDVAFHLTASLCRYRDSESVFALAALCAFVLRAQAAALAATRRVNALATATLREQTQARDDLESRLERALQLATLLLAVAGRHAAQSRRNSMAAEARVARNLGEMSKPAFGEELETVLDPLMRNEYEQIDFTGAPPEVFARIERERVTLIRTGNGHARSSGRLNVVANNAVSEASSSLRGLGALKAELDEMRGELRGAAEQLGKAARERRELEELLREAEHLSSERALALEEARGALELSVADARERLARFEREQQSHVEALRARQAELTHERDAGLQEIARLRRDLDAARGANENAGIELTRVLQRTAATELEREDLLTRVAGFDAEREVAARTIDALKEKVSQSKEQIARRDETLEEMQHALEELREELVSSETRLASTQASMLALETEAEQLRTDALHTNKAEQGRTVSESRLTQAQTRLSEAERRISQLEAALSDGKERLTQAEGRIKEQRRNVEVVSGQLAEAETLSNERAEKTARLEAELADARRALGEANAKLGETSARLSTVSSSGRDLEKELAQARTALDEQRRAAQRLDESIRARDAEIARLRSHESEQSQFKLQVEEQTARLRKQLEHQTQELSAKACETEKESEATRQKLVAAELRLMDVQQKLAGMEEDLRAGQERNTDASSRLQAEIGLLRERLSHAEAERGALAQNLGRGDDSQRGERAALEKRLATLEEQAREREKESEKARVEADKVRRKLDETDAFLIARQRELERVTTKQKYLVSEIKTIADLRTRMEQAVDAQGAQALASEIAKRLDNLFSEAGAPVHADRRTEKIVVLHLKKSEAEIAADAGSAFVATGEQAREQAEVEKEIEQKEDTRAMEAKAPKTRRTSKKSKKGDGKESES